MDKITHKYSLEFVEAVFNNIRSAFFDANLPKEKDQALGNAYLFAQHIRDVIAKGETDFVSECEKIAERLEKSEF
jgi:hypothetical protein